MTAREASGAERERQSCSAPLCDSLFAGNKLVVIEASIS